MKNNHLLLLARRICLPATTLFAHGPAVRAMGSLGLVLLLGHAARAQTTILGSTGSFAVMAGSTVGTTGTTTINGNLGTTGLTGTVVYSPTGALVVPITTPNVTDFNKAFSGLTNMTGAVDLTTQALGAVANNLAPGVYKFTTAAFMTDNLILDAQLQSNAVWVFQMGSTFNTTASKTVTFINTVGDSVANYGVFWAVTGATVFGANTAFEGNLLDGSTIGFGNLATINNGRALTATGTIGLDTNTINFIAANSGYSGGLAFDGSGNVIAVPEPVTSALIGALAALGLAFWRRRRAAS